MDKREMVLQAALKLFNHNGFEKTPTALISKEAGVATGTLFHYFPSKEDLINTVYLTCKDSMVRNLMYGLNGELPWKSRYRTLYHNFMEWGLTCPEEISFFRQYSNSPYIREKTKQEGLARFSVLIGFIQEGIAAEIIRPMDMEYLAILISGMFMANLEYYDAHQSVCDRDAFVDVSFCVLWDAIKN